MAEHPGECARETVDSLKGYFPGQPVQINFEVLYQSVGGRWRLFGLSVQPSSQTQPPPVAGGTPAAPADKK